MSQKKEGGFVGLVGVGCGAKGLYFNKWFFSLLW